MRWLACLFALCFLSGCTVRVASDEPSLRYQYHTSYDSISIFDKQLGELVIHYPKQQQLVKITTEGIIVSKSTPMRLDKMEKQGIEVEPKDEAGQEDDTPEENIFLKELKKPGGKP